jgi:hypothetical protein
MAIRQTWLERQVLSSSQTNFSERLNPSSTKRRVFLCHSHKDRDLVMKLISVFQKYNVDVYIDWLDEEMPQAPTGETAQKIKRRISEAKSLYYLATKNSMLSLWCPWEIGIADSMNREILVVPIQDQYDTHGTEYLQIYPHIDIVKGSNGSPYLGRVEPKSDRRQIISSSLTNYY